MSAPSGSTPAEDVAATNAGATVVRPSGGSETDPTATVARDDDSRARGRAWVLPTVIAVAAALILGGIGVVIGLLAHRNSGQTGTTEPTAALPPLVTGPDMSTLHQSCDEGFSLPTATGFGTSSLETTTDPASSYWAEYGNASPLPRAVSAPGAVDCMAVPGALCNGSNFLMHCQQNPGDSWITCIGGNNARVYLW